MGRQPEILLPLGPNIWQVSGHSDKIFVDLKGRRWFFEVTFRVPLTGRKWVMHNRAMNLTWWLDQSGFDARSWWMCEGSSQINFEDPRLVEGKRQNRTSIYRPGPIYWEGLRRHPELPELREAARGLGRAELSPEALIDRLAAVGPRCSGIAFYLVHHFESPWTSLPGDVPRRFEHYLPGFAIATAGKKPARIRFPNASIDLQRDSADELGVIARLYRFVKEVETGAIDSLIHDGGASIAARKGGSKERVLLLSRLEEELGRFGLDLSILAIQSASANATVCESFRRTLDRHRPGKAAKEIQSRLQPDILKHFHGLKSSEGINASAKRKLKDWFSQFSFRRMIADLRRSGEA